MPDPFQALPIPRPKGAYLHWALPDGLTHGRLSEGTDGQTDFPLVPDRWLVVRLASGGTPGVRDVEAWLLPDASARSAVRLDHALTGPALPPPGPTPVSPLTALGHGDFGWSGYYDNVVNRFALYDDLAGVEGSVAYLVVGWYTDPTHDPIAASSESDFHDRLERLDWTLTTPLPSGAEFPVRSIYHATAPPIH